jgi:hypothetical protein
MRWTSLFAAALLILPLSLPCGAQDYGRDRRRDSDREPDRDSRRDHDRPPSTRPAMSRSFWAWGPRNEFEFRKLPDGGWVQNADTGNFYFRETARTPEYVELYDSDRGGWARLYDDTMYTRGVGDAQWHFSLKGHWVR